MIRRAALAFLFAAAGCWESEPNPLEIPDAGEPMPEDSLTDVSASLEALLEHGELEGACERYFAGDTSRRATLLCGKSMFFDETFGTSGVPKELVSFLAKNFPEEVGDGWSKLGLIADPRSDEGLPFGLGPSVGGTVSFTCANCHVAQLPDGRYAVGAPNHAYEYGKFTLILTVLADITLLGQPERHAPAAVAVVQPMLDKLAAEPALKQEFATLLFQLVSAASGPGRPFPPAAEHAYAGWRSGTMDFLIEPLPYNDEVHIVSKFMSLWNIPSPEELSAYGMTSLQLGSTGGTVDLKQFEHGFIAFGAGPLAEWSDAEIEPLSVYLRSLRAPQNPNPPAADQVAEGAALFDTKGCATCHDGPQGMSTTLYTFEKIGTDPAMKRWLNPSEDGSPCCDLASQAWTKGLITQKLKAGRLSGLWAMTRFLHNGSVSSLEELFCVDGPRGTITEQPYGNGGHDMTCDGLSLSEKRALIAYLRTL